MISHDEIKIALQSALLGEIYPEIVAIAYNYDSKNKSFLLRYYLERIPNEDDYLSVSEVMVEFISQFKHTEFQTLKEECEYTIPSELILNPLDGLVYLKKMSDKL